MQGYNKCSNGHFYKESLDVCPYCPSDNSSTAGKDEKTVAGRSSFGQTDTGEGSQKTEVFGAPGSSTSSSLGSGSLSDRTQVFTPGALPSMSSPIPPVVSGPSHSATPFDRTFIGEANPGKGAQGSTGSASAPRAARKIVGWIISYNLDPMGLDYRIFEGNNTIGRDPSNSIILAKESTISGRHVTILFKSGKFHVKDEMSANGSFLNGEEMEIQKAYALNDGDELRLGNAVFKFKSAF